MPLPDAKPDRRIYELLKTTDLENLSFADFQGVAEKIYAEQGAEDELRRVVLLNLARLAVVGEWSGLTSAGGGEFNAELGRSDSINASYDIDSIGQAPPWGLNTLGNSYARNDPQFFPFLAPKTGTLDAIVIDVTSAAASTCNILVGIYSDNEGLPNAQLGSDASFDATTTGQKTQTSIGTITLTRGTQYWYAVVRDQNVSCQIKAINDATPYLGPTNTVSSTYFGYEQTSGSDNALPSSVTATDLTPSAYSRLQVGLKS